MRCGVLFKIIIEAARILDAVGVSQLCARHESDLFICGIITYIDVSWRRIPVV